MNQIRLLPSIEDVRKTSTAWCAEIFDELNNSIGFIQNGEKFLNKTQHKLLERFSLVAVEFAHDILLAEGYEAEIERRLATSGNLRILFAEAIIGAAMREPQSQAIGTPVALRLYDEVTADLRKIHSSTALAACRA